MIALLLLLTVQELGPSLTARQVVGILCNTVSDDGVFWEEITQRFDAFGESGRKELLFLANQRDSNRHWERGCAWRHLTRVKDNRVMPFLRRALTDSGETAVNRRTAVAALGVWDDGEAVPHLTKLLESEDPLDRAAAARALGSISSDAARTALRRALDAPSDYPWPVVEGVGRQRDSTVVSRLRQLSEQMDPDRAHQATITNALARIATPPALDLLEEIVRRMQSGAKRHWAITSALAELRPVLGEKADHALEQRIERTIATLSTLDRN